LSSLLQQQTQVTVHLLHLSNVEQQEAHHEREQSRGFSKGKPEHSILEELAPQARVAGNTLDQTTKHGSDTHTGTSETDCGNTGTLDLGGGDHGGGGGLGDDATGLLGVAEDVAGQAGAVQHGIARNGAAGEAGSCTCAQLA
jgi:hypothetical protein